MRDGVSKARRELELRSGWGAEGHQAGGEERGGGAEQVRRGTVSVGLAKKLGCIPWAEKVHDLHADLECFEKRSRGRRVSWECRLEASAAWLEEWNGQAV